MLSLMALPALTERIDRGAPGGHEFEHLMHQLLLTHGSQHGFIYEPVHGAGGDGGVDGWARNGFPGIEGPVAFQFKWLWQNIHKGENARQIKSSLARAESKFTVAGHWILITPLELKPSERKWLEGLKRIGGPVIHHWGQQKIESLLRGCPSLFARYFPQRAHEVLGSDYRSVDFKDFSVKYRARVAFNHRRIRTLGFPPEALHERDAHLDIPLRDIFIPLGFQGFESNNASTLAEVLNSATSGVILGDPGTGKSTLLSFIALLFAGEATLEGVHPPSTAIPIFVSLRDFATMRQRHSGCSLLDYLVAKTRADQNLSQAHQAFFDAALRMGEAILLFDGLDEVGSTRARHEMAGVLQNLRHEYPSSCMWVTSRIYGYTPDIRLPRNDFRHLRVGPLTTAQIDYFIRRWYNFQYHGSSPEQEEFTNSLREAVHQTPSVRRLATTPLLLTLMAFVHHGLRRLPQDRGELYALCVTMLLKTWQEVKRKDGEQLIHPFEQLRLHIQTQKDYLAHLAFSMQHSTRPESSEGIGLVRRSEALGILAQRHLAVQMRERPALTMSIAREEMEQFLDYIGDRTGLLIDRGGGYLSFIHLSFQEYLAAWVFTCDPEEHNNIDFFKKYLAQPSWEEVLLLRLYIILRETGGGGHKAFDSVITSILAHLQALQSGETKQAKQGWLFLGHALRDNLGFSAKDRLEILTKLIDLWAEGETPNFWGGWFSTIQEVIRFSAKSKEMLREAFDNHCLNSPGEHALAGLHLRERLLSLDDKALQVLQRRRDISQVVPGLTAFLDVPAARQLLSEHASESDWLDAFNAFSSPEIYRLTLHWAMRPFEAPSIIAIKAAAKWLWLEILAELRSRLSLVSAYQLGGKPLFADVGSVCVEGESYAIELPLSGLWAPSAVPSHFACEPSSVPHESLAYDRLSRAPAVLKSLEPLGLWAANEIDNRFSRMLPVALPDTRSFLRVYIDDFVGPLSHQFSSKFRYRTLEHFSHDLAGAFSRNYGHRFIKTAIPGFVSVFVSREDGEVFLGLAEHQKTVFPRLGMRNRKFNLPRFRPPAESSSTFNFRVGDLQSFQFFLVDFWGLATLNHLLALCRHMAVTYPWGFSESEASTWMRRHPLDVYATVLSWDEIVDAYKMHSQKLTGPEGALLLAHAAYAAIMTGMRIDTPKWRSFVAKREKSNPLTHSSYCLHEICHFRKVKENAQAFDQTVASNM
jgi:AcrR family transcriptional regulator